MENVLFFSLAKIITPFNSIAEIMERKSMHHSADKERKSLSDSLRVLIKGTLDPIAAFTLKIGLTPNSVTMIGLLGHIVGAVLLGFGYISWGGIVILVMAPVDVLDGAMARLRGNPTPFGAFLDSVTDRYEELFIFGGLLFYFLHLGDWLPCILIYVAAAGSLLVSYVRSRAEALNFSAKVGLLTRFERYLVLIPALILNYPIVAIWILAILTNFTAIQRIWFVGRQANKIK
jgi:CDP-diacylglycerol--glycerol-3-phosphate 3-phosphatidyltransferase